MAEGFTVDMDLLAETRRLLQPFEGIHWLVGGAATGKTTLSKRLAQQCGIPRYDIDEHTFGDFGPQYTPERHPATHTWSSAADPFGWMLSLEWEEFSAVYRANRDRCAFAR